MGHSNLPALAFFDAHERLPWEYAERERVEPNWPPWLAEAGSEHSFGIDR
jgi:hypothetical protein